MYSVGVVIYITAGSPVCASLGAGAEYLQVYLRVLAQTRSVQVLVKLVSFDS